MIEPILTYISEPLLNFGNGQTAIDPRDGLILFGPFDKLKVKGSKNIGISGPEKLRGKMKEYLKKIHKPIINSDRTIARPNFPGGNFLKKINFFHVCPKQYKILIHCQSYSQNQTCFSKVKS